MRLFLAVRPAAAAHDELRARIGSVRRALSDWESAVRWVRAEDVHLTLRFFGETPASRLPALVAALGEELPMRPFPAEVDGAGVFTARGRARTLWLSCGLGRAELTRLHAEVSGRLRSAGWPDEDRPFAPHLTIGRIRDRQSRRVAGLAEALAGLSLSPVRWVVDGVVLLSSDLSGPRPVYTVVRVIPLGGPD